MKATLIWTILVLLIGLSQVEAQEKQSIFTDCPVASSLETIEMVLSEPANAVKLSFTGYPVIPDLTNTELSALVRFVFEEEDRFILVFSGDQVYFVVYSSLAHVRSGEGPDCGIYRVTDLPVESGV